MALTEAAVTACLKSVVDPNTGRDFVSAKAVKKVAVDGADVTIDVRGSALPGRVVPTPFVAKK